MTKAAGPPERAGVEFTIPRSWVPRGWSMPDANLRFTIVGISLPEEAKSVDLGGDDIAVLVDELNLAGLYKIGDQVVENNRDLKDEWFIAIGPKGRGALDQAWNKINSVDNATVQKFIRSIEYIDLDGRDGAECVLPKDILPPKCELDDASLHFVVAGSTVMESRRIVRIGQSRDTSKLSEMTSLSGLYTVAGERMSQKDMSAWHEAIGKKGRRLLDVAIKHVNSVEDADIQDFLASAKPTG